jgi:hypothetical protein
MVKYLAFFYDICKNFLENQEIGNEAKTINYSNSLMEA